MASRQRTQTPAADKEETGTEELAPIRAELVTGEDGLPALRFTTTMSLDIPCAVLASEGTEPEQVSEVISKLVGERAASEIETELPPVLAALFRETGMLEPKDAAQEPQADADGV